MSKALALAVKETHEEILAGETIDNAVDFMAIEHNVNRDLLYRKLIESYGEHVEHAAANTAAISVLNEKIERREQVQSMQMVQLMGSLGLMSLVRR